MARLKRPEHKRSRETTMNENRTDRPCAVASDELTLSDLAAMAGPEFAEWLCGLFGGDVQREQQATEAKA
jgi:hypothetical protein